MVVWVVDVLRGGTKLERFMTKNQPARKKIIEFGEWMFWGGVKYWISP